MGYYVRAFCTVTKVPPIGSVLQWLDQRSKHLELDQQMVKVDSISPEWDQAAVVYKKGKLPILVECNRDTGTEDSLLKEEISEFLELIGNPGLSLSKRQVISHLNKTRYVVACQLPTSDIDDDGYDANAEFLNYFVENCGGLIQADGEGFYNRKKLIVKLS
jgi:hypothetical protein